MSFEFTVLSDDRFIEILQAWVDSPWPKTAEEGYALRDRFGWTPDYREPALFTSDVRPHESSSYFTARDGKIKSLRIPVTDIAPGGVWVFRTVCFERVVLSSPGCLWPGRMDDHEEVFEAHA